MEIQDVQLTAPATHSIVMEAQGEWSASPIIGSVTVTVASDRQLDDYRVSIELSRTVGFRAQPPAASTDKNDLLFRRIIRRRSIRKQSGPFHQPAVCANVATLMKCNLWHAPEKIEHSRDFGTTDLNFTFAIPIPNNLPATTDTVLGNVSYVIKATVSSASGSSIDTIRPIRIQRCLLPQHTETMHHVRSFAGEEFTTELRITPQASKDRSIKTAYAAQLAAYRTITRGVRKTEMRHAVIKELKWMVEETVKGPCSSRQEGSDGVAVDRQGRHVHRLCEGRQKGIWKAMGHSAGSTEKNDKIEIPFEITIPRSADATNELENCEEAAGLTVDHRLRLDIVTGEDTFDQVTGRLVDRRPRKKSFVAFFALPVHDFASGEDVVCATLPVSNLPNYEDSVKPPNYEVLR